MKFKEFLKYCWWIILIVGLLFSIFMIGYSQAQLDSLSAIKKSLGECENYCINKSLEFENNDMFAFSCAIGCHQTALRFLENNN